MAEEAVGTAVNDALRQAEEQAREQERQRAAADIQRATEQNEQELQRAWQGATEQRLTALSEQNSLLLSELRANREELTGLRSSLTERLTVPVISEPPSQSSPAEEGSEDSLAPVAEMSLPEVEQESLPPSESNGTAEAERKYSRRKEGRLHLPFRRP